MNKCSQCFSLSMSDTLYLCHIFSFKFDSLEKILSQHSHLTLLSWTSRLCWPRVILEGKNLFTFWAADSLILMLKEKSFKTKPKPIADRNVPLWGESYNFLWMLSHHRLHRCCLEPLSNAIKPYYSHFIVTQDHSYLIEYNYGHKLNKLMNLNILIDGIRYKQ